MPANSKAYMKKYMRKYLKNKKNRNDNRSRKRARYKLQKSGRVRVNDWREVDHRNSNPKNNSSKNLRVISRKLNRRRWTLKAIKKRQTRKRKGGKY